MALGKASRSKAVGIHQGFNCGSVTSGYGVKRVPRLNYVNGPAIRRQTIRGRGKSRQRDWGKGRGGRWGKRSQGRRGKSRAKSGGRVRFNRGLDLRAQQESHRYGYDHESCSSYARSYLVSSFSHPFPSDTEFSCRKGRRTKNVVPTPMVLSAQMRPP